MVVITFEALCAGRAGETLVGPLDLTLHAGEALVVTGENGAGKSTLLRTLAGLIAPISGRVRVEGALASDGEPARDLADIAHYLGHRNAMKGGATLKANLSFWHRFLGGARDGTPAAIEAALDAVALAGLGDTPLSHLSTGQQRRAALARLCLVARPLWILDEPIAALDSGSQSRFADLARVHLQGGGLIIAATHQPLGIDARDLVIERRPLRESAAEFWT